MKNCMLRLLRDRRTGRYWTGRDWVSDWRQARCFADIASLCTAVTENQFSNAEEVLQFGEKPDSKYDIRIKLADPARLRIQV